MRWRHRMLMVIVATLVIVGCGGQPAVGTDGVHHDKRLVIYSGRNEALLKPVVDAFRAKYPDIRVDIKSGKNSELAAAIIEERTRPQADVFISTDMLTHINLSKEGVFAAAPIAGSEGIPQKLKASDGSWTSITSRARVIMYNTTLVRAEDVPTSIFDLTDPKWQGKIAAANATNGSMQAQVATMQALVGDTATAAWLAGLVANKVTFFSSHTDVRKAVGAGEFAIGLVNHYYYELQKRETSDNQVGVVYPDQGDTQMGVMVNTTAIGQLKNAPNPAQAQLFAEFLFTPTAQSLFATANYEYPLVPGIAAHPDVKPMASVRVADTDMYAIATRLATVVPMMNAAGIP